MAGHVGHWRRRRLRPQPARRNSVSTAPDLTDGDASELMRALAIRERTYRYAIAAFVLVFAALGLVTLASRQGPTAPWEIAVAVGFFASTIPVGLAVTKLNLATVWWSQRTRWRHAAELFVLYADVGLTATVLTFQNANAALFGCTMFTIIGAYVAHFLGPTASRIHILATSCVIIGIGCWGMLSPGRDIADVTARVLVALFVVNGTVALQRAYTGEIKHAIRDHHTRASTDPLTGIANRRAFTDRAARLIQTANHDICVMIIDVDDFKTVNDDHGHERGDQVLIDVARALESLDPAAVVGRLGGDEFAVAAQVIVDQHAYAATMRRHIGEFAGIRVSVGSAVTPPTSPGSGAALSAALAAADGDLYMAKKARKRRQYAVVDEPGSDPCVTSG